MATRNRIPILSEWPGPWEQWAKNYCSKNWWRVASFLGDEKDFMAECAVLWVECRARYGSKVDNPAWFMHLYQLMVMSRFNDLSVKDTRLRAWSVNEGEPLPEQPVEFEETWLLKIKNASREARAVLDVLQNAPFELLQTIIPNKRLSAKKTLERVARFCGITDSTSVIQELHTLLS